RSLIFLGLPHPPGRAKGPEMNARAIRITVFLGVVAAPAWLSAQDGAPVSPIHGFSAGRVAAERAFERRFREQLDSGAIEAWHRYLTSKPHPATPARTKEIAEHIAAQWKAQGLGDVVIHRYDVLSSNPRKVRAELVAPVRYVPTLREDPVKEDADSSQKAISGGWLSFSASGDVTAPVVY